VGSGAVIVGGLFVDAFQFIGDNASLLLQKAAETAELAFTAFGIAVLIALPLGLWLGHKHKGLFLALGASTVGRALPSIVLIGLFIALLGVGFWNNTIALVVLGIPPILTNSFFAIEQVDPDVVEAARGMGLTEPQIVARVELPLGLPLIIAGLRISVVFVIATATIAAIVGGGGLGDIIVNPASYGQAGVFGAAFCLAALALLTSSLFGLAERAARHRMAPRA
jgi:osmoprotectant transport system permease protein